MRVDQKEVNRVPETAPATVPAELAAHVNDIVGRFAARATSEIEPAALEALWADVLELARAHAARTVFDTITARDAARAAKRQRRSRNRRAQARS